MSSYVEEKRLNLEAAKAEYEKAKKDEAALDFELMVREDMHCKGIVECPPLGPENTIYCYDRERKKWYIPRGRTLEQKLKHLFSSKYHKW